MFRSYIIGIISLMASALVSCAQEGDYTRGIGVYPGRLSEDFAPSSEVCKEYRNVALDRKVFQSSSLDANLTGQLDTTWFND